MDAPAARSNDASTCPACGRAIDPLRAGHVAILDGAFRYFCGAECKSAFLDSTSRRPALDALTAEPPQVAPSGVRAQAPTLPEVEVLAPEPDPPPSAGEPGADEPSAREPSVPASEPPSTLRSAAAPSRRARKLRADRPAAGLPALAARVAPPAGILAGVLAAAASLAGEAGAALGFPLAVVAAALLVARAVASRRDDGAPSAWVTVGPVALAVAAEIVARAEGTHATSAAAFIGLAAAAALLAEGLTTRARRDVDEARARAAEALAVRARVVRGDRTSMVDADTVKPGEEVVVEAGEVIAVDGLIEAGAGEVAPWLDSPVLARRREGDAVVAGATLTSGRLRVRATFTGADRAWLRLAHEARVEVCAPLVVFARSAIERGAPIAAVVVAVAVYANNGTWPDVVLAACAGAFALAAASSAAAAGLAHARGHVSAQRRGVVYKDAEAFDAAARADVAVVCSRGTVLLGEPEIVAIEGVSANGTEQEVARVLALAAGAELSSTHPFAQAILRAARARDVRPEDVRSAIGHSGLGVTALVENGDKVIVGSRAFLLKEKVSVAVADARASELEAQGRSVLLVALGERLVGLLALQDGLRPGARAAIQRMHDARIEPVLLSGEARDTCETIARALDIEHVRPEILPADRGAEVRALAFGGHMVAAVGHPSSDDGALGAAEIAVAMGAAGAAPGEWGVALASDDVRDAALALTVPRACRDRARSVALGGAAAQLVSSVGIAFGVVPPALAPVIAVLASAWALAAVREPAATAPR